MSRNSLSRNDELRKGDYLISNNKEWKAIFQDDGNFVVYGWKPVWASNTNGTDAYRLCMQEDCNLVMYNKQECAMWSTSTSQNCVDMVRLQLKDNGKLVLEKQGKNIWRSSNEAN